MNIAILASGNGSNFQAIAKAAKQGYLKAKIKLLICDKQSAFVRLRARKLNIRDLFVNPKDFKSGLDLDKEILRILKKEKIDLVVLAGYLRVLSSYFVRKFKNKILNIHPALLPSFPGTQAIARADRHGCKVTGVTVHFVDEGVDSGPIILQEAIKIKEAEAVQDLEKRIHHLEHKLYPRALKLLIEKRLKIKGRNVKII